MQYQLFQGFSFQLRIYNDFEPDRTHLLISSPKLLADIGVPGMTGCSKISELLRLLVSLLGLQEIRAHFVETTSVFR